jgi:hypothetical protein
MRKTGGKFGSPSSSRLFVFHVAERPGNTEILVQSQSTEATQINCPLSQTQRTAGWLMSPLTSESGLEVNASN